MPATVSARSLLPPTCRAGNPLTRIFFRHACPHVAPSSVLFSGCPSATIAESPVLRSSLFPTDTAPCLCSSSSVATICSLLLACCCLCCCPCSVPAVRPKSQPTGTMESRAFFGAWETDCLTAPELYRTPKRNAQPACCETRRHPPCLPLLESN